MTVLCVENLHVCCRKHNAVIRPSLCFKLHSAETSDSDTIHHFTRHRTIIMILKLFEEKKMT